MFSSVRRRYDGKEWAGRDVAVLFYGFLLLSVWVYKSDGKSSYDKHG